jgi:hypothetical protein
LAKIFKNRYELSRQSFEEIIFNLTLAVHQQFVVHFLYHFAGVAIEFERYCRPWKLSLEEIDHHIEERFDIVPPRGVEP